MRLGEQVILITGGASGIGRYLAQEFAGEALQVVIIDKDREGINELRSQLPSLEGYACDITKHQEVEDLVTAMYERDGKHLTVLINNAGVIHSEPLVNMLSATDRKHRVNTWSSTIDANLNSVFYVTSCVVAKMVERRTRGLIINVSSVAASGNAGQSAYSATKAAVNALTVTWSKELGPFGIRSVAVAPGFVDTPSTRRALSEVHMERWRKSTPVGRLGKLEEIGKAVRFVIENDFFNGRVLEIDGGLRI